MSFERLVDAFKGTTELPILVDDLRKWIIGNRLQDEIWFFPVEINVQKLKGAIKQYTYRKIPYAEPIHASNIYYASTLNTCWSRLVCCKEMMHIFDRAEERAGTRELVGKLTFDLTSPSLPDTLSAQYMADWVAVTKALIALVPEPVLEQIRPLYKNGSKKAYDIALFLRIPEFYVEYLCSDNFAANRVTLLKAKPQLRTVN